MYFKLQKRSSNKKTGPLPVISASMDTCPTSCPLKDNGCYGHSIGYIKYRWEKLSHGQKGLDLSQLIKEIKALPHGLAVRYGEVGDLPGNGYRIDRARTLGLARAFKKAEARAFTYTHYLSDPKNIKHNLSIIQQIHSEGAMTINISTENLDKAAECSGKRWPTVCTIPDNGQTDWKANRSWRHKGEQVIICPAVWREKTQCISCGGDKGPLCYRKGQNRNSIICFPAHSPGKKKVNEVING